MGDNIAILYLTVILAVVIGILLAAIEHFYYVENPPYDVHEVRIAFVIGFIGVIVVIGIIILFLAIIIKVIDWLGNF